MDRYEILMGKGKEKKISFKIKSSDIIKELSGYDKYITAFQNGEDKYSGVLMFNYGQKSVRSLDKWGPLITDTLEFDSFEESCASLKSRLPKMYSDAKIYYQE